MLGIDSDMHFKTKNIKRDSSRAHDAKIKARCDIRALATLPGTIILASEVSVHGQQNQLITKQMYQQSTD